MKKAVLKITCKSGDGYTRIVSPENSRLRLIEFGIVKLARRESFDLRVAGKEVAVTLVKGQCIAEGADRKLAVGPRKNVFEDQPWAVYARGIERLKLTARTSVEALVSSATTSLRKPFMEIVEPRNVVERIVGSGTYERRVRTIIGENFPARRLLVGETINGAGKWSSYPPHRHEKESPPYEVKLEEVYYYKLEKSNGFGVQRIYTDDGRIDETHTVRDGDLCILPRGYHPVAAIPSSRLYYFWALAGRHRKMRVRVDPNFA